MKLELRDIAPYLPHDVKVRFDDKLGIHIDWVVHPNKDSLYNLSDNEHIQIENLFNEIEDGSDYKLILRPLTDLTNLIEVNGRKIVPLLELRDIEQGNWDDGVFIPNHSQIIDYGVREGDSPVYWVEWIDGMHQTQSLSFKDGDFSRVWLQDRSKFGGIQTVCLSNQMLLFQKLHEWHFDTNNLIKEGLAININTLK